LLNYFNYLKFKVEVESQDEEENLEDGKWAMVKEM
jgi:hypothetical protein